MIFTFIEIFSCVNKTFISNLNPWLYKIVVMFCHHFWISISIRFWNEIQVVVKSKAMINFLWEICFFYFWKFELLAKLIIGSSMILDLFFQTHWFISSWEQIGRFRIFWLGKFDVLIQGLVPLAFLDFWWSLSWQLTLLAPRSIVAFFFFFLLFTIGDI